MILAIILIIGIFLRFYDLGSDMMFIGDQAWFYLSARDALLTGRLPISGITASITWLHQGPLWTYLLIPALGISYHPVSGAILTSLLSSATLILLYYLLAKWITRNAALAGTLIFAVTPQIVLHARMPYHTSPIPLFTVLFFLLLARRKLFLAGLFLGFLYQLHLLTFIFWPLSYFAIRHKPYAISKFVIGFFLGIIPFIVSGPVQTLGIFAWISKKLLTGFGGTTLYSEAYLVVLFVPAVVVVSWILSRLPRIVSILLLLLFTITSLSHQIFLYGPGLNSRLAIARSILSESRTATPQIVMDGPGAKFATYSQPYTYLIWWLSQDQPPSGTHTKFLIHEISQTFEVLE